MTLTTKQKEYIKETVLDQEGHYTIIDLSKIIHKEEWMQNENIEEIMKEVRKHEIIRLQNGGNNGL